MGRGRAKAKQTKVARELKYRSVNTDFASLERELRTEELSEYQASDEYDENQYADLAAQYGDAEDDDYEDDVRRSS